MRDELSFSRLRMHSWLSRTHTCRKWPKSRWKWSKRRKLSFSKLGKRWKMSQKWLRRLRTVLSSCLQGFVRCKRQKLRCSTLGPWLSPTKPKAIHSTLWSKMCKEKQRVAQFKWSLIKRRSLKPSRIWIRSWESFSRWQSQYQWAVKYQTSSSSWSKQLEFPPKVYSCWALVYLLAYQQLVQQDLEIGRSRSIWTWQLRCQMRFWSGTLGSTSISKERRSVWLRYRTCHKLASVRKNRWSASWQKSLTITLPNVTSFCTLKTSSWR